MSAEGSSSTAVLPDIPANYIKFPPFPAPPAGKKILSFKEFRPSGIQIVIDPEPGHVELDGLGIPTVQLRVKHDLTEAEQKKKRKIKGSKTTVEPSGKVRRLTWWEEWEQHEDMRKMSPDIAANRVDRMYQACDEFKTTRTWPPQTTGVQQLWDFWRLYIGVISSIQPPGGRKKGRQPKPEDVEEDSDEDDDKMQDARPKEHPIVVIDALTAREQEKAQQRLEAEERRKNNEELYKERYDQRQDRKYARMSYFFDDPEYAMKIFFSAHFRDKGYAWNEVRCRDGPILIEFFMRFLLRNRVFPEYEEGFKKALAVCETARFELPQTSKIAKAFPERFGKGCAELMGKLGYRIFNAAPILDEQPSTAEPDAKKRKTDNADGDAGAEQAMQDFKATVDKSNLQLIDSETVPDEVHDKEMVKDAVADNIDVTGIRPGAGWGSAVGETAQVTGWGNSAEAAGDNPASATNFSWGDDTKFGGWGDSNEWEESASTSFWNSYMKNPIFDLLGPTLLPLTHTTGIVENSVRRISKIVLPDAVTPGTKTKKKGKGLHPAEAVEAELEQRLAQVTLAPWFKIGNHTSSDIEAPSILPDSRGPVVQVRDKAEPAAAEAEPAPAAEDSALVPKPHDPSQDDIVVLMDPEVAKILTVGMGQRGIWVQLVRTDTSVSEPTMGKIGGPGKNGEPTKWWYLEDALGTFVSFHTDRYYPDQD